MSGVDSVISEDPTRPNGWRAAFRRRIGIHLLMSRFASSSIQTPAQARKFTNVMKPEQIGMNRAEFEMESWAPA
jgi:hypothetical protein